MSPPLLLRKVSLVNDLKRRLPAVVFGLRRWKYVATYMMLHSVILEVSLANKFKVYFVLLMAWVLLVIIVVQNMLEQSITL